MLHGFSGSPGTGKSLNAIKFIIENDDFSTRPVYYHGIRCLLLDFEVCKSFAGWLYGVYYPLNSTNKSLVAKLKKIDKESRLASIEDFPYLAYEFKKHDPVTLWVTWFKKVASKTRLALFDEALKVRSLNESDLTAQDIESLGLSWTQFHNPLEIHELPSGTIILVDEVQNIWPTRPSSKKATPDIEMVTTHRHNGQELVYISQDFRDVDQLIRRRIAHYTHFEFLSGDWLYKYQHNNLFDPSSKNDLNKVGGGTKYKRDSKYYGLYLSSIEHTQTVRMSPVMKSQLRLGAFALSVLCFGVYLLSQNSLFASVAEETPIDEPISESTQASTSNPQEPDQLAQALLTKKYVDKFIPRFDAIPFSAPVYDSVTSEAVNYPQLTCFQINDSCECFTQQSTSYDLDFEFCSIIAKNGFFDPFKSDEPIRKRKTTNNKPTQSLGKVFQ
jgi:hypothetical protein